MGNTGQIEPDFRVLFDSVPGLYLVLSPTSGFPIVAASNAFLKASLTRREELVGRSLLAVFPDNPAEPQATGFANLGASLERVTWSRTPSTMAVQKFYLRRPPERSAEPSAAERGGFEERWWSVDSSPVLGPSDALQYIICCVQDVTASRKVAEPEFLREEWASLVAHDLQQPVHALVLSADLLRRQVTDEKARRTVERVRSSALRLSRMIQDLAVVAKLESRQLSVQPEPLALCGFVREVLNRHPDACDRFALDPPTEGELQVLADSERIEQVLTNLLSNAIRYSEPATAIRIEVKLQQSFAQLSVISQGPRIPPDELLALFEHFMRRKRLTALPGAGLGLHVARGLIEAHGGRIWAECGGPEEITRFHFTLPLDAQTCARLVADARQRAAEAAQRAAAGESLSA